MLKVLTTQLNPANDAEDPRDGLEALEHKAISGSSVVRGLVAVGLLAFKGIYNTGKEVSCIQREGAQANIAVTSMRYERGNPLNLCRRKGATWEETVHSKGGAFICCVVHGEGAHCIKKLLPQFCGISCLKFVEMVHH